MSSCFVKLRLFKLIGFTKKRFFSSKICNNVVEYTSTCQFAAVSKPIPTFRLMTPYQQTEEEINIPSKNNIGPGSNREWCSKIYQNMVNVMSMDKILYDAQRQGRIPFYMTCSGEEGALLGSASALNPDDVIFAQYREVAVLLYRGFTLDNIMNQCFANSLDPGKGRQMPVHYGSPDLHFHTISSPLGTQLPQAVGAAYSLKRQGKGRIVVCYFGEGAASEGDFHAALNFAATTSSPVLFFCRNNGYAISTPTSEQYRGDGIGGRGAGYGIRTIRVDGNDTCAVHEATRYARTHIQKTNEPVLIEAMTYRVGHHSTSDDSNQYRKQEEVNSWLTGYNNPVDRLRNHMILQGWLSKEEDIKMVSDARADVLAALERAEKVPPPALSELFTDVYADIPLHLKEQQSELEDVLKSHPTLLPKH